MTIEKGKTWGSNVARPTGMRTVVGDAGLAAALTDGSGLPTAPTSGDLHRTVGGRDIAGLDEVLELPIDLLHVTLDDGVTRAACAHVSLQHVAYRGGWWRGDVLMVMNADFLGAWRVAKRGHPNDGRAESCSWSADFNVRQRAQARRRLPLGTHIPHPLITTRSFRNRTWDFDVSMVVKIDGVRVGRTRTLEVNTIPDAAIIYT